MVLFQKLTDGAWYLKRYNKRSILGGYQMKKMTVVFGIFFLVFALSAQPVTAEDKGPVIMVHTCPLSGVLGSVPDKGAIVNGL